MRLQRHSVSLAWRLDREIRKKLILHETGFSSYFINVDALYLFLNWFSTHVSDDWKYVCGRRLYVCIYKYTKIQGLRFQRTYIITRDQKSDLHGTSFQSSPKISRILITKPICIQWKFTTVPTIAVLLSKIFFSTSQ